jgi:hypothetical protein
VLTIADTTRVASFLRTQGIDAHAYSGEIEPERRLELEDALIRQHTDRDRRQRLIPRSSRTAASEWAAVSSSEPGARASQDPARADGLDQRFQPVPDLTGGRPFRRLEREARGEDLRKDSGRLGQRSRRAPRELRETLEPVLPVEALGPRERHIAAGGLEQRGPEPPHIRPGPISASVGSHCSGAM